MTESSVPASDNQEESQKPSAVTPSLFRSVSLVAIITIVSKMLGLVRDQMIAHAYGASMVSDAYLYAFQIPSFSLVLLGGLGGPFHTATVSVLSKILKEHEAPSEKAQRLTNTFITASASVFAILALLTFCFAPQVIEIVAAHASPQLKILAVDLTPLPDHAVVADVVYVPLETNLLLQARRRGLRTSSGLGMLLHQAVPGFERWFGRRPQVTPRLRARVVADIEGKT